MTTTGRVSFVGAGPGAADLITLRGARRIAEADVVIDTSDLNVHQLRDRITDLFGADDEPTDDGEGIAQVNNSIQGHNELQQALFAARSRLDGAITFHDVHVIVDDPKATNARVNFRAVARLSGQTEPFSQDLKAQFVKINRDWLISRVDPISIGLQPTTGD